MKRFFLLLTFVQMFVGNIFSQDLDNLTAKEQDYQAINVGLATKNMHLWRGYKVTNNAMTALNVNYSTKNDKMKIGFWNGISFDGSYTEFDYYFSYVVSEKLSLSVWDINNFSDYPDANIFDYRRESTSHFVDVNLTYSASKSLILSWSTIVAGRDFQTNDIGKVEGSFSNFVEARVNAFERNNTAFGLFVGGAFSFRHRQHFYGNEPAIVNFGFTVDKEVSVMGSKIPVSALAMWNPEQNYGAMQFQIGIF